MRTSIVYLAISKCALNNSSRLGSKILPGKGDIMQKKLWLTATKQCFWAATAASFLFIAPVSAAPFARQDNSAVSKGLDEQALPPQRKVAPIITAQQEEAKSPIQTNQIKIRVDKIHITGQNVFDEKTLLPLVEEAYGRELTLGELENYAKRITQYFHQRGYLVAKAFIPAQTIDNGALEITVLVGQYGKIQVQNHSALHSTIINRVLRALKTGDYIQKSVLERTLLLLSDVDGVTSEATLSAGEALGTSNLTVELKNAAKTSGQLYVDNHGSAYTGKNRLGFNWNFHNFSGQGDSAALGLIVGKDMEDYTIDYQLPTNGRGAKLGVGYSSMHYSLGEDFADLDADGVAKTVSLYKTFALTRSRTVNFAGRIGFDHKELEDTIHYFDSDSRKKNDVWNVSLNGDAFDGFAGGGYNQFNLAVSLGRLRMASPDSIANDINSHTAGTYQKMNINFYRVQNINPRLNLHLSFFGQLANKNLDSSEKISLGGPSGVRAYPLNEASGDEGYVSTSELRWDLPNPDLQLVVFADSGHVVLNKDPWTDENNGRTLSGVGIGLLFSHSGAYAVRVDYAWKTSSAEVASDADCAGRFWLQGVTYF